MVRSPAGRVRYAAVTDAEGAGGQASELVNGVFEGEVAPLSDMAGQQKGGIAGSTEQERVGLRHRFRRPALPRRQQGS